MSQQLFCELPLAALEVSTLQTTPVSSPSEALTFQKNLEVSHPGIDATDRPQRQITYYMRRGGGKQDPKPEPPIPTKRTPGAVTIDTPSAKVPKTKQQRKTLGPLLSQAIGARSIVLGDVAHCMIPGQGRKALSRGQLVLC